MAFSYADYMAQATAAARLSRARLHHGELSALVGPEISKADASRSSSAIAARLADLEQRVIPTLERQAEAEAGVGVARLIR